MTWIDIDKELEWVTTWDKEDRHVGVISKHECVVDVEWVEELLTQVKRLREMLYIAENNIPRRIHWDCYVNALVEAGLVDMPFEEGEEE